MMHPASLSIFNYSPVCLAVFRLVSLAALGVACGGPAWAQAIPTVEQSSQPFAPAQPPVGGAELMLKPSSQLLE